MTRGSLHLKIGRARYLWPSSQGELRCRGWVGRLRFAPEARSLLGQPLYREPAKVRPELFGSGHHRAWSRFAACVLDFTADRRATLRARSISTHPSAAFGSPVASPERTARAAASRRRRRAYRASGGAGDSGDRPRSPARRPISGSVRAPHRSFLSLQPQRGPAPRSREPPS
jgi:hypothetical protein